MRVALFGFVGLLSFSNQLGAQAGLLVPTSTGRPDASVLSLREMAIDVGLARGYARVNVRQVFENHTAAVQEGTYRFALPSGAAVGDFAVWDGLARIPGVILEKRRARAIYRELTTQRIDPGLLQQGEEEDREPGAGAGRVRPSGGALFSVRVAPIPPFGTKRIEMQLNQELPVIGRVGEFRLALRPPDGEAPVAGRLVIRVRNEDGRVQAGPRSLALQKGEGALEFSGTNVTLERDLVVRTEPGSAEPLKLAAFRNPEGALPDGLALAPWERMAEIPPEKDGFFLLELMPPGGASTAAASAAAQARPPVKLGILFDTSLSQRWMGLEAAYGQLVRVLNALGPEDRFAVIPFDRESRARGVALASATRQAIEDALNGLRARALLPGTDPARAIRAARDIVGADGRLLVLTDGQGASAKALGEARGALPLFVALSGSEAPEAWRIAATELLTTQMTEIEGDLFFTRILAPLGDEAQARRPSLLPFAVSGGEPRLRDVYPVLLQPPTPGGLSGWIGRYVTPQARLQWELRSPLLSGGQASLNAPLPERALAARDLPRRWARARVDDLLRRIEEEGERREWVDEIIDLSRRYKFVTPYTAFLAAPRSLLRPRRIQPGDPVLRVECDEGTVAVVALFPFGLRLPLVHRPGGRLWEGRFLAPSALADGRYQVRLLVRDASGAQVAETKSFVLDGTAPVIRPDAIPSVRAGETVRISARADEDVIFLSARVGAAPPVALRWDPTLKRSSGTLLVPSGVLHGQEVVFEAVDGAKNVSFARARLEVRP
jgi:Ca-activated chloride channel homolog